MSFKLTALTQLSQAAFHFGFPESLCCGCIRVSTSRLIVKNGCCTGKTYSNIIALGPEINFFELRAGEIYVYVGLKLGDRFLNAAANAKFRQTI